MILRYVVTRPGLLQGVHFGGEGSVLVPPDPVQYWSYGNLNTTIVDRSGLPWYCYTAQQTQCRPLFKLK